MQSWAAAIFDSGKLLKLRWVAAGFYTQKTPRFSIRWGWAGDRSEARPVLRMKN